MKLTMNTILLQELVSKSMKGASNNKMVPITGLMAIEVKDNKITLITTDATNFLYIKEGIADSEDFYVVVQADMFAKLISKLTCTNVTLEVDGDTLKVVGNGHYALELPLDENGELVVYPNPLAQFDKAAATYVDGIHKSTFTRMVTTAKSALATSLDMPVYSGYYVGDVIVATDTYKICGIAESVFDEPQMLSSEFVDLTEMLEGTSGNIDIYLNNGIIVADTDTCSIFGKTLAENIDDFQIEAINGLLKEDFASSCKISKGALLQLLDRLALFVGIYDKNGIKLTFARDGIMVESRTNSGVELIPYLESSNFENYKCEIDIEMLKSQVKANSSDTLEIHYGNENAIKITDGDITQIIALITE